MTSSVFKSRRRIHLNLYEAYFLPHVKEKIITLEQAGPVFEFRIITFINYQYQSQRPFITGVRKNAQRRFV